MSDQLPPHPFHVLIVAKTHLKTGFCVGGIAQNGCSVRLQTHEKFAVDDANNEYEIGDVWRIEEYTKPMKLCSPHVEDIIVHSKKWVKPTNDLIGAIERFMPPVVGGINELFDGAVRRSGSGWQYVGRDQVPSYSTLFWRLDRPLHLVVTPGGKFRYSYDGDEGKSTLSYVGTANAKDILEAGTLIRVSLARWWLDRKCLKIGELCYLQVSGWYEETEEMGESNEGPADEPSEDSGIQVVLNFDGQAANSGQSGERDNLPVPIAPLPYPSSPSEPVVADLQELLRKYFGFQEFRPYQREIIESVLARRDTLVIMSTGAGKSLCYQLPAIAFSGLTVVISPLISLMQDQVMHLQQFGIAAATLNSHCTFAERDQIRRQIRARELKLLYLSPEMLASPGAIELLQAGSVDCLVVDEAHCISQSGHDFRPEYRQIPNIHKVVGDVPILAVTATATAEVREDIAESLQLRERNEFVAPFNRPNLFLAVQPRQNGTQQVLDFLGEHAGQSGIIYCLTRNGVDSLTETLQGKGINALPYHAGLEQEVRQRNQRRFVHEEATVMVATVAFGMGIDKPDIRFVLHFNLPGDPESYYQQIGRAGRDGDRADCLLLHSSQDMSTIRFLIEKENPERAGQAIARLQHMGAWVKNFRCRRKWLLEYFGEQNAPDNCGMCDACVVANGAQVEGSDDITDFAFLFLSCVKQVRQNFGVSHVIDILLGSKRKKVLQFKHDQLAAYGQGHALKEAVWKELAIQFFKLGLMTKDEHGAVNLTEGGRAVLDGEKVYGNFPTKQKALKVKNKGAEIFEGGDLLLFEKLRLLRRQLADERGVPSFVIFSDKSLRDMAIRQPKSMAEFREVHGVGEHKSREFGELFIEAIRSHGESPETPAASSASVGERKGGSKAAQERRDRAFAGLRAGKSLDEVADECGVSPITVIRYIYRHYKVEGQLPEGIVLPRAQVSPEVRDQVFILFAEHGLDELGPIYWAMNETVDYTDLDLLRIEYLQTAA